MYRTFNCGIGLVIAISAEDEELAISELQSLGETVYRLGKIEQVQSKDDAQVVIV